MKLLFAALLQQQDGSFVLADAGVSATTAIFQTISDGIFESLQQ